MLPLLLTFSESVMSSMAVRCGASGSEALLQQSGEVTTRKGRGREQGRTTGEGSGRGEEEGTKREQRKDICNNEHNEMQLHPRCADIAGPAKSPTLANPLSSKTSGPMHSPVPIDTWLRGYVISLNCESHPAWIEGMSDPQKGSSRISCKRIGKTSAAPV
jgi:hypothetical protein